MIFADGLGQPRDLCGRGQGDERQEKEGSLDTTGRNPGAGESAKQQASQVKEQVQQQVVSLKDTVTQQAAGQLEGQKEAASGGLQSVARAFRQTSDQLREQDQAGVAGYLDRATAQVEHFSEYLGKRDLQQMARDTEQFARREPTLFLGGALVLGLFASRFLKSSQMASAQAAPAQAALPAGNRQQGTGQQGAEMRQQAERYIQNRPATPASTGSSTPMVPPLPPRTTPSPIPNAPARTTPPTGAGTSASGGGTMPPAAPATGTGMGSTGAKDIAGTSATGDVIVGGPPLPSDVIVGGPPREPGQGPRQ